MIKLLLDEFIAIPRPNLNYLRTFLIPGAYAREPLQDSTLLTRGPSQSEKGNQISGDVLRDNNNYQLRSDRSVAAL